MRPRAYMLALLALVGLLLTSTAAHAAPMHGIPTPPHVQVVYGPCPFYDGGPCANEGTVYLPDGAKTDSFSRQHELGHLADAELLDDAERAALTPVLGARGPWFNGTGMGCGDGSRCPSERFADAYATCRLGWRPDRGEWADAYGYDPTPRTHRRVCAAIRRFLAD